MKEIGLLLLIALMLASAACTQQVMLPIQSPTLSALAGTPSQPPTPAAAPSPIPTPAPLAPAYMEQTIDQVLDYSELLAEVNATRKAAIEQDTFMDMSEYLQPYEDTLDLLSSDEIEMLLPRPKDFYYNITPEQAIEDTDYLFKLIKCGYGPYFYFGGNAAFDAAKESLLNSLPQSGDVAIAAFVENMTKSLSFVKDDHFTFGWYMNTSIIERNNGFSYWYINSEQVFSQDEQGWYKLYGNEKWSIAEISVPEGCSYQFVPTIDDMGRIVYTLAVLMEGYPIGPVPVSTTLVYNTQKYEYTFQCKPMKAGEYNGGYSLTQTGEVAKITIRGFAPDGPLTERSLEDFVKTGKQVRNDNLLVIDIRGNGGGNSLYPQRWIEGYTGRTPQDKCFIAQRVSKLPNLTGGGTVGKWRPNISSGKWINTNSQRIVLTDRGVGSSGESYVFMLRTLSNTLFVGSNTVGCTLSGNASFYYLPNSHIVISIPMGLQFHEKPENIDGRGIDPDIWVMPSEALDRTLAMLEYYGVEG